MLLKSRREAQSIDFRDFHVKSLVAPASALRLAAAPQWMTKHAHASEAEFFTCQHFRLELVSE
jgi:hypothetical protein